MISMENEYVKETKIIDRSDEDKRVELMVSIMKAKKELDEARRNFEYAEGDLIDYYTYQIKANRSKFDYLLKQAKKMQIQLNMIEKIEINGNEAI